jgi:transcription termination factor Rho
MSNHSTSELNSLNVRDLQKIARDMKIKNVKSYKKAGLIKVIYETQLQADKTPKKSKAPKPEEKKESKPKVEEKAPEVKTVKASQKPDFHRRNNRKRSPMTFRK